MISIAKRNAVEEKLDEMTKKLDLTEDQRTKFRPILKVYNQKIRDLINGAIRKQGLQGATPKSGRFVVRLPRSLHAALELEAQDEGVSLNQLVVAKLSMQMRVLLPARKRKLARQ